MDEIFEDSNFLRLFPMLLIKYSFKRVWLFIFDEIFSVFKQNAKLKKERKKLRKKSIFLLTKIKNWISFYCICEYCIYIIQIFIKIFNILHVYNEMYVNSIKGGGDQNRHRYFWRMVKFQKFNLDIRKISFFKNR